MFPLFIQEGETVYYSGKVIFSFPSHPTSALPNFAPPVSNTFCRMSVVQGSKLLSADAEVYCDRVARSNSVARVFVLADGRNNRIVHISLFVRTCSTYLLVFPFSICI